MELWPAAPNELPPVRLRRRVTAKDGQLIGGPHWDEPVELPEDFCLREVIRCPLDDESIAQFVSQWGLLTPVAGSLTFRPSHFVRTSGAHAIAPNPVQRSLEHNDDAIPTSVPWQRLHLQILQALALRVGGAGFEAWEQAGLEVAEQDDWHWWQSLMNAGLSVFHYEVRIHGQEPERYLSEPPTFSIAVLQLARQIAEGRTVLTCANDRCRALFTRQRGRAKYKNSAHATGVKYCSAHCAKAQAERSRRERMRKQREMSTND